jgi:hypothetical protein
MAGDITITVAATPVVSEYTQALAKRVIRKIDRRVLLIMFVTYNLNFMDKTVSITCARYFRLAIARDHILCFYLLLKNMNSSRYRRL